MILIALFGLFLIAVSLFMLIDPKGFVKSGIAYCNKPYMHPTEISICLVFGASLAYFGPDSRFPMPIQWLGYVLLAVGCGLVFTPPSWHRRYGIWSLETFSGFFRPASVFSLVAGGLVVYGAF